MSRLYKKFFALLGIIIITFLPVMTPTAYAISSWSGDPWEGSPWSGDSWDGSSLDWSGNSWNGNSWNGDSWNQSDWNGNSWTTQSWSQNSWDSPGFNGNSWTNQGWDGSSFQGNSWTNSGWSNSSFQGNPWSNSSWSMYGFNGNPWLNSGWAGNNFNGTPWGETGWNQNGIQGNPWSNNGWNQNGIQGNPWLNNGFISDPFRGNETNSDTTSGPQAPNNPVNLNTPFYDTDDFKNTKFVWDYMVNAAVDMDKNFPNGPSTSFLTGALIDSIKFNLGDHIAVDLYDIGDKSKSVYDSYNTLDGLRQSVFNINTVANTGNAYHYASASKLSQFGSLIKDSASTVFNKTDIANISSTWGSMGAISKLNVIASGVNAGISAYKTGESVGKAINTWQNTTNGAERTVAIADIGANLGETIMSVGGVTAAIPGGQALGAGLLAVGGGLFVISKGTQLVTKNWDKISNFGKKTGKAIADGAKKLGSTIKGWFS
ncbi:hypothetical protein [Ornithinibacillus sp. FSL M8-0202]|uniref:hypothetical protein n=1 Tax=unclassified Ornithinibacillus TaxID=2620869 RepID=UPI0030D41912